jgi:hypothetical protein
MAKMAPNMDHFMPHMEVTMRNFHFIVPHIGLFMEHMYVQP